MEKRIQSALKKKFSQRHTVKKVVRFALKKKFRLRDISERITTTDLTRKKQNPTEVIPPNKNLAQLPLLKKTTAQNKQFKFCLLWRWDDLLHRVVRQRGGLVWWTIRNAFGVNCASNRVWCSQRFPPLAGRRSGYTEASLMG